MEFQGLVMRFYVTWRSWLTIAVGFVIKVCVKCHELDLQAMTSREKLEIRAPEFSADLGAARWRLLELANRVCDVAMQTFLGESGTVLTAFSA